MASRGPILLAWADVAEARAQTEARVYTVVERAEGVSAVAQVAREYSVAFQWSLLSLPCSAVINKTIKTAQRPEEGTLHWGNLISSPRNTEDAGDPILVDAPDTIGSSSICQARKRTHYNEPRRS